MFLHCAPRLLGVLALQKLHEGWQQFNQGGVFATDRPTRRSERRAPAERGLAAIVSATQARDPTACAAVSALEPGRAGILPPLPSPRWSGYRAWRYHVVAPHIGEGCAHFHRTQQFTLAGAKVSNGAILRIRRSPAYRPVSRIPAVGTAASSRVRSTRSCRRQRRRVMCSLSYRSAVLRRLPGLSENLLFARMHTAAAWPRLARVRAICLCSDL